MEFRCSQCGHSTLSHKGICGVCERLLRMNPPKQPKYRRLWTDSAILQRIDSDEGREARRQRRRKHRLVDA